MFSVVTMNFNTTEPTVAFDETPIGQRQPRLYGPLLGFFLANLLSNAALAKYSSFGGLRVSYDPSPWLSQPKPNHHDHYNHDSYWRPIEGPPGHYDHSILTTAEPHHVYHHHQFKPPLTQQQIININGNSPTEIIIEEATESNTEIPGETITEDGLIPAESEMKQKIFKRAVPRRYESIRRNRYPQKQRKRFPEYFYDSFEDYMYKPKRKPSRRPLDSYEEEYEYDSFEFTTKPYRKRTRPTQRRNRYKNKTKKPEIEEYDYEVEKVTVVRPRQQEETTTTAPTTTTTTATTTTTTPTTTITNGSTPPSRNFTGYGYGPASGHDHISITYGPPQPQYPSYGPPKPSYGPPGQYQIPFNDWYNQDISRNSVVKKVHDIIGFDNFFQRRLT